MNLVRHPPEFANEKTIDWPTHGLTLTAKPALLLMNIRMSQAKPPLDGLRIQRGAEQNPQPKMWLPAALVAAALLLVAAFWWHSGSNAEAVSIAVARDATSGGDGERIVLNASGYVTARREATVSSKVTGKVTEVFIEEGMKVTNGQVLARLDDTNVKASLDVAQAQLESAQAALEETRAQLKQADQEFQRVHRTGQTTHRVAIRPGPGRVEREIAWRRIWRSRNSTSIVAERQVTHVAAADGRHDHPRAV